MLPVDAPPGGPAPLPHLETSAPALRLYVARSTPNSVRAEQNLALALDGIQDKRLAVMLTIIDVFVDPKQAIKDGVVVTPTLIGSMNGKRIILIGDMADQDELRRILVNLLG